MSQQWWYQRPSDVWLWIFNNFMNDDPLSDYYKQKSKQNTDPKGNLEWLKYQSDWRLDANWRCDVCCWWEEIYFWILNCSATFICEWNTTNSKMSFLNIRKLIKTLIRTWKIWMTEKLHGKRLFQRFQSMYHCEKCPNCPCSWSNHN